MEYTASTLYVYMRIFFHALFQMIKQLLGMDNIICNEDAEPGAENHRPCPLCSKVSLGSLDLLSVYPQAPTRAPPEEHGLTFSPTL